MSTAEPNGTPVEEPTNVVDMATAVDPFSPEAFKASQEDAGGMVETTMNTIKLRKPNKDQFVRSHHDPSYTWPLWIHRPSGGDDDPYLLTPKKFARDLVVDEQGVINCVQATLAITRQGDIFLWEWKAEPSDGRDMDWWRSNRLAVGEAQATWLRMKSNKSAAAYEITRAKVEIPDPKWPEATMQDLVFKCFPETRRITSMEHEVIKRLRGLA